MLRSAEEWRPIDGFPGYHVSSLGRVQSFRRNGLIGTVLRPSTANRFKRRMVTLYAGGEPRYRLVARLVCEAFHGKPKPGQQAAHRNGTANDDRAENLYWATPAENTADRDRHGRTARGSGHYAARLTESEVSQIRAAYREAKAGGRIYGVVVGLAQKHRVSIHVVEDIVYGRKWRHVA